MPPLPILDEARARFDARRGLPDDNLPDPDGGDYERRAVEIGPSGLPARAAALMGRPRPDLLPLEPAMTTLPTPEIRRMTIAEWIRVPTNPSQRDHANRRAAHLDRLEPQHLMVSAAELPDGTLVKLDGHTRAHRWAQAPDRFPHQQILHVAVYRVQTQHEAIDLYRTFDSPDAVESSRDQLAGALRVNGMDAELARTLALNSAMETVVGKAPRGDRAWLARAVAAYRDEVEEIFRRARILRAHKFKSGMIGALILGLRHHPRTTLALLDALDSESAPRTQVGRKRNVLCALADLLKEPGRQNHTDPAAERVLGILYVAHKDGVEAMRARFPRASLPAYRQDGTFHLADQGA